MICDEEIKKLILSYQKTGENLPKIKELLSEFIYHFPAIAFETYHEDIKGDFYLYFLDRLEKTLKDYKVFETAKFKTYFYLVLRRHYLNFIQGRKKELKTNPINSNVEAKVKEADSVDLEKISLLFASLPQKYRLILKLRCPDFLLPEDLYLLGREFHKEPAELLKKIDMVLRDQAKKENRPARSKVKLASPRVIADFLGIRANLVSKWLVEIKKIAQEKVGEIYVSG